MNYTIENPSKTDGKQVWELIKSSANLDLNSSYAYFILCDYFSNTCAVTRDPKTNQIVGFLSTYESPTNKETLFVWQVAVAESAQRNGLARKMLDFVLQSNKKQVTQIHTTITPSNEASERLFNSVARDYNAIIEREIYLDEANLGGGHEPEYIFKIGPLNFK